MKTHGIIENDCEDFISSWCAKVNSVQHHKTKPLDFCASTRNERPRRPRPSSRQKVTMVGHFPSCFTKYSQESNQIYIYEALSNHVLWNFGGKNLNTEPASVDCADSFESRVDFFIIFSAKLYWLLWDKSTVVDTAQPGWRGLNSSSSQGNKPGKVNWKTGMRQGVSATRRFSLVDSRSCPIIPMIAH